MKCDQCGSFDSMANHMYVDKNHLLLTENELIAFGIVHHRHTKNPSFSKVILCGICYETIDSKKNRVLKIKKSNSAVIRGDKRKRRDKTTFYICYFCQSENEPLRSTCRKCEKNLFSTDYETKQVSSSNCLYCKTSLIKRLLKYLTQ